MIESEAAHQALGSGEGDAVPAAPQGRDGVVRANSVRLHYLAYGNGDRDLLIIPGITSPAITWEFVAQPLAADRRVVAYDIRGRGLSEAPPSGYTLSDYAADAAGLIQAVGLRRPAVLGHSMGGRIAAALADTYPHLVGPMIIVDPPLTGPGRPPYPTSRESFRQQLHEAYAGTTAEEVRRFYPRWSERALELRAAWLPTCDEHAVLESHRLFDVEDFFAHWARLVAPVLFLYGGESPVIGAEGLAEVHATNPGAEIIEVTGAGHMIPWENLDDFLAAVERFLADHT
jgi:N-formylmaleamate deformylase